MAKLKVYRTPAGFHDAYVAAPSQKAALAAWGSDADLFARGIAEIVTDAALTAAPLARPGEVVKVARTMADATPEPPRRPAAPTPAAKATRKPKPRKPKAPRPSRARLEAAEAALDEAERGWAKDREALRREEEALARRRRALETSADEGKARLEAELDAARAAYDRDLARWRDAD